MGILESQSVRVQEADTAGNCGVQKKEKQEKVLKLSLLSCDLFFTLIDSREFVWQMGVLI